MLGELIPALRNKEPDLEARERSITMSNALARAVHRLTLSERRLIALAATKLFKGRAPAPGESPVVRVTALEYAETCDIHPDTAYTQLRTGSKSLLRRYVTFFTPAYRRNGKRIEDTEHNVSLVGRASYQKGEGWVELVFWHEIAPHLMGLEKNFTKYQLEQLAQLRSVASWDLLKLLMQFESTGWAEYTIEDFCKSMNATDKQVRDFAKIRTKIIEPAVQELIEKDGWIINWKPIKAGRKVVRLRFDFKRDPQGRLL